jgi:hypothetical protein
VGNDNKAAVERIKQGLEGGDLKSLAQAMDAVTADDFVTEWPQSGERISGKAAFKKINENYASATGKSPTMKVRRISGEGDLYILEGTIDYGDGTPVSYVGIAEFKNGKVVKNTEYFANPFEAPAWRADYVERMQPALAR